jgi:hypothetical protein
MVRKPMRSPSEGDQAAGEDRGEDRPPVVGGQLRRGQGSHAGEGDLAEPDHAAFARHEGEGQEDDAVGEGLCHQPNPEALHDDGQ